MIFLCTDLVFMDIIFRNDTSSILCLSFLLPNLLMSSSSVIEVPSHNVGILSYLKCVCYLHSSYCWTFVALCVLFDLASLLNYACRCSTNNYLPPSHFLCNFSPDGKSLQYMKVWTQRQETMSILILLFITSNFLVLGETLITADCNFLLIKISSQSFFKI